MAESAFVPSAWYDSNNLQKIHAYLISHLRCRSSIFDFLLRGNAENSGKVQGRPGFNSRGKNIEFMFEEGYGGGSSGFGGGTKGTSLAGIGEERPLNSLVAFTPHFMFYRAVMDTKEMELTMAGSASYGASVTRFMRYCAQQEGHTINSILKYDGQYAKIGLVTEDGGATVNHASTLIPVKLTQVSDIPIGTAVEFYNNDFSAISNSLPGIAMKQGVKDGEGFVYFKFPTYGSTPFNIPNDAQVCLINSKLGGTNRSHWSGLPKMIGVDAHPRNEAANTPNSSAAYRSTERLISGQISNLKLEAFLDEHFASSGMTDSDVAALRPQGTSSRFDEQGRPVRQSAVWRMNQRVRRKLHNDFWEGKNQWETKTHAGFGEGTAFDEGRQYTVYQGVPIQIAPEEQDDRVYFLHRDAFSKSFFRMFEPLPNRPNGFTPLESDTRYEFMRQTGGVLEIIHRDRCGVIRSTDGSPIGISPDELEAIA